MFKILKEAPDSANLFGTYSEGPVFVGIECLSGLTRQYEANLVRFLTPCLKKIMGRVLCNIFFFFYLLVG